MEQKLSIDSPIVQAIVEDFVMMYANSEQSNDKSAFFRQFTQYVLISVTERIERFNKLCSILNPKWRIIHKGNAFLLQGMQWKLEHMDEG